MVEHNRPLRRKLSRRRLLAGGAVGVSGLALAVAIGCDDGEETAGGATPAATGTSGGSAPSPGISDTEIKIGNTLPYTGPIGIAGQTLGGGGEAYFKYVNEELGGVNGRKITFISYDDAYDPSRTVEQTRRLVQQDKVFALWEGLGTPQQQSVSTLISQADVPRLLIGTGANEFGDPKKHPNVTIGVPSYYGKGALLGAYVAREKPNAQIAVLHQNDDLGRSHLAGFEAGLGVKKSQIVKRQTYEPTDTTLEAQLVALKDSNADIFFFNSSGGRFLILGLKTRFQLGWDAETLIAVPGTRLGLAGLQPAGLETVSGAVTTVSDKDPLDPRWANDPAVKRMQGILDKYKPGLPLNDAALGMMAAAVMVQILRRMKEPTRDAVMEAARTLPDYDAEGLMLPGMFWSGSRDSNFMARQAKLARFNGTRWEEFGDVQEFPNPPAGS